MKRFRQVLQLIPRGPMDGFAALVERARYDGVEREENLPFLLEGGEHAEAAVLLVHGFTGSPDEMRLLGERIAEEKLTALGVCLPGHGTSPEHLAKIRWEQWLETVQQGYSLLAANHKRVYGVGSSTGSLLLLALAAQRPFPGLVLLSPFLRMRHRLAPLAGVLRHLVEFHHKEGDQEGKESFYDRRPLAGVHQLNRLIRHVRGILERVDTPVLAIGAEGDETVSVKSALELFRRLPGSPKAFHLLGPEAPHVLAATFNPRWAEVFELTCRFLLEREKDARTVGAGEHRAP